MRALSLLLLVSLPLAGASPYSKNIEARNLASLRSLITREPVAGLAVGNSIMEGGWVQALSDALPALRMTNAAVGGAQTSQMGFVVAPLLPGDALTLQATRTNPALRGQRFALVGGTRNEADSYNSPDRLKAERIIYEGVIDDLLAAGVEPVVVSDPPQIDMATGAIYPLSAVADPVLVQLQRDVARTKGVTFVNVWAQFMAMAAAGQDLRPLYIDGTHPEAPGRQIIANMVRSALTAEPTHQVKRGSVSATALVVAYPVGSGWRSTPNVLSSPLSTLVVRGRSEVYALNTGETASVLIPNATRAWVNTVVQPHCGDVTITWMLGSQQFPVPGCSGPDTIVHREQTNDLGPVPAGRLTVKNNSARLMEVVGVLLALPR